MKALKYKEIQDLKQTQRLPSRKLTLILDRLVSIENVAHIFRLSDALALESIILYKMDPNLMKAKTEKLSRSTTKFTPYHHINDMDTLNSRINNKEIIALEWTDQSRSIFEVNNYQTDVALLVGSESNGLSKELLNLAKQSIHLPMYGVNSSINAAMATSIASYHILHS